MASDKQITEAAMTIQSVEEKDSKGGPYLRVNTSDGWMSSWHPEHWDALKVAAQTGARIMVGYSVDGKFKNVEKVGAVPTAPETHGDTPASPGAPAARNDDLSAKDTSIQYQTSIKAAAEVMAALVAAGGDENDFPALIERLAVGAARLADGADAGREPTVGAIMKARALLAEGSAIAFGDVAADFSAWLDINFQVQVINGLTARQVVIAAAAISRLVDDQEQAGAA